MKLFTASWCSTCTPVKQFIKSNNLDVEIVDVDTEKGAKAASALGVRGLPTLVDGDSIIVGDKVLPHIKGN